MIRFKDQYDFHELIGVEIIPDPHVQPTAKNKTD